MAAIEFQNVRKVYRIGKGRGSLRDAVPAALNALLRRNHQAKEDLLWALKGVSFEAHRGETVGIIGPNGAGKTTILKLLSRVTRPTSGHIAVNGRVSALIELGAGFHPDLTGRENIYLNASILGLSRREIEEKFDSIVEFAELAEFIDTPVKRYSSGMYVRLGFSVAAHVDPDILLIDEVLAVGDHMFKDKCIQRIKEFRNAGKCMVIVSHSKEQIQKLCDRAILLHKGEVVFQGDTQEALDRYHTAFATEVLREQGGAAGGNGRSNEDREMEIVGVSLLDSQGKERLSFLTAEPMALEIRFRVNAPIKDPVFYSRIRRGYQVLHGTTTARFNIQGEFKPGDTGIARVHYKSLNLLNGEYNINVGIKPDHFSPRTYDFVDSAVVFTVGSRFDQGGGVVYLDHDWDLEKGPLPESR